MPFVDPDVRRLYFRRRWRSLREQGRCARCKAPSDGSRCPKHAANDNAHRRERYAKDVARVMAQRARRAA